MKPALTAEEWTKDPPWGTHNMAEDHDNHWIFDGHWRRHELAARCLHNQPFGFTREDVTLLHVCADYYGHGLPIKSDAARALASRIEALLPPETTLTELLDGADWSKLEKPKVGR